MHLTQHATFHEFEHYARGLPASALARRLRCQPSTVHAWSTGKRPPPWWTVAVLRLDAMERDDMARQMGYAKALSALGVVRGQVIDFSARRAMPAQRLAIPTETQSDLLRA